MPTMRRDQRFVAFIGGLSVVVSACGSSPSAPTTTGPFVVTGLVLDFQTNAAVSGAIVSFGSLESATVLPADPRALTDGAGSAGEDTFRSSTTARFGCTEPGVTTFIDLVAV